MDHAVQFPLSRDRPLIPGGEAQTAYNLLRHNLLTPGVLAADDYRGGCVLRRELEDLLEVCPGTSVLVPAAVIQMLEIGGPEEQVKVMADLKGTEIMVEKQAKRLGELEEALLARGAQADALARITSLEGDIAQAEAAARVDYQHYTQQEFDLRLQIKSLTETKDDIFKNGLGLYNDLISLRTEHEAAQAATAAAQAATAVAQAEAAADRAKAVRICTALAGTDANADRTPTAQLEAVRQYIAPEFAEDADDYIREQAQEAVDCVINARKEQELQEAAGGDNYI